MAHVAEWKIREVEELKNLIDQYPVIGIANLVGIPAKQLQQIRNKLRGEAVIRVSKKTLIKIALEKSNKDGVKDLSKYMEGQVALILTKMNPFKLYKLLDESKTPAPAKPGAIAPNDIVVPKCNTGLDPGPILGELQQAGIPAKIEGGKIVITDETVVVKAGEEIPPKIAEILNRLDIQPLEIGVDLIAVYEDGDIYTADILSIDEEKTISDIQKAYRHAFNLSVNAPIYVKETMPYILQNAAAKAFNLSVNAGIITSKTIPLLLSKAYNQMVSLASTISKIKAEALDEDLSKRIKRKGKVTKKKTKKKEKEEKEEEKEEKEEEEEAAAGLGALFG